MWTCVCVCVCIYRLRELTVVRIQYIPQVNFADLQSLSEEELARIKRRGNVIIKDVVPDEYAMK